MVPIERGDVSRQLLNPDGATIEWRTHEMGHSVCVEEIGDIAARLGRVLRSLQA